MSTTIPLTCTTLLFLVAAIAGSAAQVPSLTSNSGSCLSLATMDLGSTIVTTPNEQPDSGVVSNALDQPEIGPPEVRILDFQVVCESAGLTRDTVSSVSAIVTFECTGQQCEGGGREPVNSTEQFTFRCIEFDDRIIYEPLLFPTFSIRRLDPVASFATVPDTQCGLCLDPANGMTVDDVTHCIGERLLL